MWIKTQSGILLNTEYVSDIEIKEYHVRGPYESNIGGYRVLGFEYNLVAVIESQKEQYDDDEYRLENKEILILNNKTIDMAKGKMKMIEDALRKGENFLDLSK